MLLLLELTDGQVKAEEELVDDSLFYHNLVEVVQESLNVLQIFELNLHAQRLGDVDYLDMQLLFLLKKRPFVLTVQPLEIVQVILQISLNALEVKWSLESVV